MSGLPNAEPHQEAMGKRESQDRSSRLNVRNGRSDIEQISLGSPVPGASSAALDDAREGARRLLDHAPPPQPVIKTPPYGEVHHDIFSQADDMPPSNVLLDAFDFDALLKRESMLYCRLDGPVLQKFMDDEKTKQEGWLRDEMVFAFPVSAFFQTRIMQAFLFLLSMYCFFLVYDQSWTTNTISGSQFRLNMKELRGGDDLAFANIPAVVAATRFSCLLEPSAVRVDSASITLTFAQPVDIDGWLLNTTGAEPALDPEMWAVDAGDSTANFRKVVKTGATTLLWRAEAPTKRGQVFELSSRMPRLFEVARLMSNCVIGSGLLLALVHFRMGRTASGRKVVCLIVAFVGVVYMLMSIVATPYIMLRV